MQKTMVLYNNKQKCIDHLSTSSKAASIRYMKYHLKIIQHILSIKGIDAYLFKEYIYPCISYEIHTKSPIYFLERKLLRCNLINNFVHFPICNEYSITIDINTWNTTNTSSKIKIIDIHKNCICQFNSKYITDTWALIYHLYCELYMVSHYYYKLDNDNIRKVIQSIDTLIVL